MNSLEELPLSPYRVLDLSDGKCDFCARILADMGADVIKVEPLDGSSGRNIGPFYHDTPDPNKSLYWFVYNANKRSITLNLTSSDGKSIFNELVKTAQVVIESLPPEHDLKGYLSYTELSKLNPSIVAVSITPFGLTGPYRNYKAPDLIGTAMGGAMYLTGDPDLPPLFVSFPQAYLNASAQAAVATMIALWYRELSGEGQQVDVSMQESVTAISTNAIGHWEFYSEILSRSGPYRVGLSVAAKLRQTWKCKDGYVSFILMGGKAGSASNKMLIEWLASEGMADDFLKQMDPAFDMRYSTQEFHDHLSQSIERFFLTHTKAEIAEEAFKRGIMLYPVSTIKDLVEAPQLKARDFWEGIEHPELGKEILTYAGPFAKLSETPWENRRRAPLLGEHNLEVYQELGLSKEELASLKQAQII
jgi:benzylsuccinate CoA-transferase BbsE subunit